MRAAGKLAFNEAASRLYEKQGFGVLRQYLRKQLESEG